MTLARRIAVFTLLLAGLGLCLREAVVRANEVDQPGTAAAMWPASGNALALLALQRASAADGVMDAEGRSLIARALARTPSAGLPIGLAGIDASADGDLPRATRLMEMARHRAPRLLLVRGWLINEYARTERFGDVLGEAGPVMRLSAESRPQVYALISAIAARPNGASAVRAALAADPDWKRPYLQWQAEQARSAVRQ